MALILAPAYFARGGSWVDANYSLATWYVDMYNSPAAITDYLDYKVYLEAGTYTFRVHAYSNSAGGLVDFELDGTVIATFDLYGPSVRDKLYEQTGVSVTSTGWKTLRVKVNSGASRYRIRVQSMYFARDAS